MTMFGALTTALIAALFSSSVASALTRAEYRPAGIGYRIEMPGQWVMKSQDVPTDLGNIELHMAIVDAGEKVYMSIYSVYPQEHVDRTPAKTILDNSRDGAVKNLKGTLFSEKELEIGGHPARHFVVNTSTRHVSTRAVLVGNTMIAATYVGPAGSESEPDPVRFFNSLSLTTATR